MRAADHRHAGGTLLTAFLSVTAARTGSRPLLCGRGDDGRSTWLWFGIASAAASPLSVGGFRAGIGAGADGVLVRRATGRSQWVPWTEVERFDALEKKGSRGGVIHQIAVIRRDAKPLITAGCCFSYSKRSQLTELNRTLDRLERERLKANHRLGLTPKRFPSRSVKGGSGESRSAIGPTERPDMRRSNVPTDVA